MRNAGMRLHWMSRTVAALAAALLAVSLRAQTPPKKILVLDFDQTQVQANFRDIFGQPNVNVGRSIAQFLASRLGGSTGLQAVQTTGSLPFTMDPSAAAAAGRANHADAVIAGSIIVYGSASGTAGVGVGPRIGSIRLNIGRRTTVVAVQLEVRLIDVASGQLIGVLPANAQGTRSGLAIGVEVGRLIDASGFIDMTRYEFRHTAIGEYTDSTVSQLAVGVTGMADRIGNMAPPPPPVAAAAPTAPAAPVAPAAPAAPSGPVVYPSGPFAYAPWQFRGTEHFRYTVSSV
jgi:curli biogenesis system outer membrane secretion channel CsgG